MLLRIGLFFGAWTAVALGLGIVTGKVLARNSELPLREGDGDSHESRLPVDLAQWGEAGPGGWTTTAPSPAPPVGTGEPVSKNEALRAG